MPTEIDVVTRRIRQLEIERVALSKRDPMTSQRNASIVSTRSSRTYEKNKGEDHAHWQAEKEAINTIRIAQRNARRVSWRRGSLRAKW